MKSPVTKLIHQQPSMKTLSIIIPHFNSPKMLDKLLQSIPNEPWISIIVVDDNSTLKPNQSNRDNLHFYTLPADRKGAGAARNLGLNNTHSDWVLFADADDFFVEEAFTHIEQEMNNEQDCCYFLPTSLNIEAQQTGTRHQCYKNLLLNYQTTKNKTLLYKFFVPWSKLISTQFIKKHNIQFDEIIASNDMNFSFKVAYFAQKSHASSNAIYCVTESCNSLTKQTTEAVLDSRFYAAGKYNDFCQNHELMQYQLGMAQYIYLGRKFGTKKVFSMIKHCLKHGYPLSRGLKPLFNAIKKDIFNKK